MRGIELSKAMELNNSNIKNEVERIIDEKLKEKDIDIEKKNIKNNNIFLVHGHDENVMLKVKNLLLELKLEPIILHERPNKGRTLIEKFEQESDPTRCAIVLMTADDTGKSNLEKDYHLRARQNVILELGYFIGKLGRKRVIVLYSPDVEVPSDILGVVYEKIDNGSSWKYKVAAELKEMGYNVSKDNI